jgi:hypothetical protein
LDARYHQLHAGINQTCTHLRQHYWIQAIRQYVKTILRSCVVCRKVTGKAYRAPDPPPLPAIRVSDKPPFTITGVDFSGALHLNEEPELRLKPIYAYLHVQILAQFTWK